MHLSAKGHGFLGCFRRERKRLLDANQLAGIQPGSRRRLANLGKCLIQLLLGFLELWTQRLGRWRSAAPGFGAGTWPSLRRGTTTEREEPLDRHRFPIRRNRRESALLVSRFEDEPTF